MAAARTTGAPTAGRGGIESLEQVALALLEGRQQRFQILVLDACVFRVHRLLGVEIGRHDDFPPPLNHRGVVETIGEIECHPAIVRGDEGLPLLQGVPDPQLAKIARGVSCPGLAGDGDDGSDGHESTPWVRSACEAAQQKNG